MFHLLKSWDKNAKLTLKLLTLKLVILLLLVTSQWGQTIIALSLEGLELGEFVVFKLKQLLKHNRLGEPLDKVVLRPFDQCKKLCVVRTLKSYIRQLCLPS